MLARVVVAASLAVFVATQAPAMLASGEAPTATSSPPFYSTSRLLNDATLTAGRDGHFAAKFVINGRPVAGLIDTGATFVALNELDAQHIGINSDDLVYDHTVATAAGDIKAARVTLATLTVGNVSLKDVDALVVRDGALPTALIGMSFLGRLSSYAAAGDVMRLVE